MKYYLILKEDIDRCTCIYMYGFQQFERDTFPADMNMWTC